MNYELFGGFLGCSSSLRNVALLVWPPTVNLYQQHSVFVLNVDLKSFIMESLQQIPSLRLYFLPSI